MTQQLNSQVQKFATSVFKFNPWPMVNQKHRYMTKEAFVVFVASGLNFGAAFEFI